MLALIQPLILPMLLLRPRQLNRYRQIAEVMARHGFGAVIAELGLEEVVHLLGWRRDVVELLHAMDVFLLTSLFEGLPRAVLQAMAAGTAVVATAVDGTPEVVRDRETGLLVPPSRPAAPRRLRTRRPSARRSPWTFPATTLYALL